MREIILKKIAEIEEDERYHYEPANVQINAPLALIQVAMKAKIGLLKELLQYCEERADEVIDEQKPNFFKLWDLKCVQRWRDEQKHLKDWYSYEIYAKTTKDLEMSVWNGTHPVEKNTTKHICKAGTKVRVWMVSRFGDVGVTDNLETPKGYDVRGLDADADLTDYEFIERRAVVRHEQSLRDEELSTSRDITVGVVANNSQDYTQYARCALDLAILYLKCETKYIKLVKVTREDNFRGHRFGLFVWTPTVKGYQEASMSRYIADYSQHTPSIYLKEQF